jgi:exodeoxyribonuclease VIII
MSVIELEVTHEEYHADRTCVSNTGKECFRKSQATYYGMYVAGTIPWPKPTPALSAGIWAHMAVLEPARWATECIRGQEGIDRRTTAGKKAEAEFLAKAAGRDVVPAEVYDMVSRMAKACEENELAWNLLTMPGQVEHSYKWQDSTGMWLKSRPDKTFSEAYAGQDVILDLKTCDDASPEAFAGSCRQHGYERTAAFRVMGHRAWTGNDARYLFLAVSKKDFAVGLYELQPEEIELGHKQNRRILDRMAACYESQDWEPAWSKSVNQLSYPQWAFTNSEAWEV